MVLLVHGFDGFSSMNSYCCLCRVLVCMCVCVWQAGGPYKPLSGAQADLAQLTGQSEVLSLPPWPPSFTLHSYFASSKLIKPNKCALPVPLRWDLRNNPERNSVLAVWPLRAALKPQEDHCPTACYNANLFLIVLWLLINILNIERLLYPAVSQLTLCRAHVKLSST